MKNNTDKDYDINSEQDLNEYVKVGFEPFPEDDNVLKANSTKEVYFTITYYKEVPLEKFKDSSTITTEDIKSIEFTIKNDKLIVETKNPNTKVSLYKEIIILVISGIVTVLLIIKRKSIKAMMILVVLSIITIPLTIYALDKITIDVESKIEIKHPSFFIDTLNTTKEYLYDYGMTWQEFLESDYNIDNWTQTEYFYTLFKKQNNEEIVDEYYRIGDNKIGISVGPVSYGCGGGVYLRSYNPIIILPEEYETIEKTITNGYTYSVSRCGC